MRREPIEIETETNALLVRAVQLLESIDARLANLEPGASTDADAVDFLREILTLIGTTPFAASELVAALGGGSAQQLGQRLAHVYSRQLPGRGLIMIKRDATGTVWSLSS